jgi:N2-citryl-N6-acetyl-N6-hydroxylysine synthase
MNLRELSLRHSASCFFNSLFREWFDYSITDAPAAISVKTGCKQVLTVTLAKGAAMYLPLTRSSLMGRHQYHSQFFIQENDVLKEADFLTVASELVKHLTTVFPNSVGNDAVFMERLKNSVENIELALGHRHTDLQNIYSEALNFQQAEQGLMIGHNFHPYPKMREGFDEADYRQYSPEMAGSFALNWFLAKPEIVANEKAEKFKVEQWTLDAFLKDFEDSEQASTKLKAGFIPFPVHPWQ